MAHGWKRKYTEDANTSREELSPSTTPTPSTIPTPSTTPYAAVLSLRRLLSPSHLAPTISTPLTTQSSTSSKASVAWKMGKTNRIIALDLHSGSGLCPWSSIVALHVLLNLGVEATLMCLDSLKLPSCVRTPHLTHDDQRRNKPLKF
ncbi:hypothetical protein M9H77_07614 [Catharanthus roseus]|uniref:Uncharacterized protein n=1 Tax=Catharanthus roseus TaxID=4058 RepID=A0ACC0BVQ5_CATRO|nr:hypothetical protein M9H77_07614 [Catharanthus roseus]